MSSTITNKERKYVWVRFIEANVKVGNDITDYLFSGRPTLGNMAIDTIIDIIRRYDCDSDEEMMVIWDEDNDELLDIKNRYKG